jgi:hypothetical protein
MDAVTPVTDPVQPVVQSPIHSLAWIHTQNPRPKDDEDSIVEDDAQLFDVVPNGTETESLPEEVIVPVPGKFTSPRRSPRLVAKEKVRQSKLQARNEVKKYYSSLGFNNSSSSSESSVSSDNHFDEENIIPKVCRKLTNNVSKRSGKITIRKKKKFLQKKIRK